MEIIFYCCGLIFFIIFCLLLILIYKRINSILNILVSNQNILREGFEAIEHSIGKSTAQINLFSDQIQKLSDTNVLKSTTELPKTPDASIRIGSLSPIEAYFRTVNQEFKVTEFMETFSDKIRRVGIEIKREIGSMKFNGIKEILSGNYLLIQRPNSGYFLVPYFGALNLSHENSALVCFECEPGLFDKTRSLQDLKIKPAYLEEQAMIWSIKEKGTLSYS